MKSLGLSCYAVTIGAASALLAGCGGSQPPIGAPGTMPQSRAITTHADRSGSWMLPEAKRQDLLFGSQLSAGIVSVFSYPAGRKVGELDGIANPRGLCSDASGKIYVTSTNYNGSQEAFIYEYAHGGTSPIKTFTEPGSLAFGCAVDSSNGDLAVANYFSGSGLGNIAVFHNGSSGAKTYTFYDIHEFLYCTYDDQGNLYASGISGQLGHSLLELPDGSNALGKINLSQSIGPNSIQWVDNSLAVSTSSTKSGVASIYPVTVSGDYGSVGTPTLLDHSYHVSKGFDYWQYWTQGGTIIGPAHVKGALLFWNYPQGGSPVKAVRSSQKVRFDGETVSAAK
jgi:hypothetical protein